MEQLKRRRQKLVAALMAATTLSGGKTAPPAAAMSQGLNKATTKAATNKKSGLPTWAKWLIAGGASLVGAAGIGGLIWWCLKDKNKDPKDPNETNKDSDGLNGQKNIDNKAKISVKNGKRLNFIKLSDLSEIKEDENEDKDTSIRSDNDEGKIEGKDKNVINKQTLIEKENQEEFQIINNTNEAEENEKKQKEAEAEAEEKAKQKAKQKLEQQENKDAFYEKVKDIHPLAEAMDRVKNYENYKENRKILGGCYGNYTFKRDEDKKKYHNYEAYKNFRSAILEQGKNATIKKVDKEERNENIRFIKSVLEELEENSVVHYEIHFPDYGTFNIFLFGANKIAFREITNAVLFEYDKPIFN